MFLQLKLHASYSSLLFKHSIDLLFSVETTVLDM